MTSAPGASSCYHGETASALAKVDDFKVKTGPILHPFFALRRRLASWLSVAVAILVLAGCATLEPAARPLDREAIAALNGRASQEQYILTPGDRIAVRFHYNSELDEEVAIRPDGRVSLPIVEEVVAAGRTPQELGRALMDAYARSFGTESGRYVLSIGERISIKSFYNDKLNEDVIIRPDGKISMQLVGEIQAAGVTPDQLVAAITQRLKKHLDAPEIAVIVRTVRRPDLSVVVRESASQRVFVGGEVRQAGVQALRGHLGLLTATLQAGGLLETARPENVVLLRHAGVSEPTAYAISLSGILEGTTPDVALRPMDIVYVPKSAAAETAAALRQNIYNMLPTQFQAVLGYYVNRGEVTTTPK